MLTFMSESPTDAAAAARAVPAPSDTPRDETATPAQPGPGADWIVGNDGQRLYSRWQCPGHARGLVWYVLGPETGAAFPYPRLTQALLDRGFAVALMHARGTGFSPGVRGDIDDYQAFLGDYGCFRVEIERRFPGLPVFLLGHNAHVAAVRRLRGAPARPTVGPRRRYEQPAVGGVL